MQTALYILLAVVVTILVYTVALRIYINLNTIGRFKLDDNIDEPLCTFELAKAPEEFERKKLVFVRVIHTDLGLPGQNQSQQ